MGPVELYELGPSAYQWTRFPRAVIRTLQRFFLTAWMLPLAIFGVIALIAARRRRTTVLLLSVPLYYLIGQSALHTETPLCDRDSLLLRNVRGQHALVAV